jgi:hypothetical protein
MALPNAGPDMLKIQKQNLRTAPFPYLVQPDLLEPSLYEQLKTTFPHFERAEGWSRMSKDLMKGDSLFEETVSKGPWKVLHDYFHSDRFLTAMADLFGTCVGSGELMVDLRSLRLSSYVEDRQCIGSGKLSASIAQYQGDKSEVFIRMDIGVGEQGYKRTNHLDWRHRVCSLLLYFDEASETGMVGGSFRINELRDGTYQTFAVVEPKNNLGILKLDNNMSYHSVDEITRIEGRRKTLYVAISSRGRVWT